MRTRAIDFVVYNVTDMARAVTFYRDTLGLRFPLAEEAVEPGDFWTEFDSPPVALALCTPPSPDWLGPPAVALAVADVRAAVEELRRRGVPILAEPRDTGGCLTAYIADPDGNRVCLHQRGDGTAG
jgi:predicted enzyme related to lactoylglutathione lyase